MAALQSLISPWKRKWEKKKKKKLLQQGVFVFWSPIQVLTPPPHPKHGLTLLGGQRICPCGIQYAECILLNFQDEKKFQKEKKTSVNGWENREQKIRGI